MRVHELAKELGVTSKELLAALEQMGVGGQVRLLQRARGHRSAPARLRREGDHDARRSPARSSSRRPQPRKPSPSAKPAAVKPAATGTGRRGARRRRRRPRRPGPRSRASARRAKPGAAPARPGPVLQVVHGATPQMIAEKLDRSPAEIVKVLFMAGEMVTATTSLTDEAIELVADRVRLHGRRSSASRTS